MLVHASPRTSNRDDHGVKVWVQDTVETVRPLRPLRPKYNHPKMISSIYVGWFPAGFVPSDQPLLDDLGRCASQISLGRGRIDCRLLECSGGLWRCVVSVFSSQIREQWAHKPPLVDDESPGILLTQFLLGIIGDYHHPIGESLGTSQDSME